MKDVPTKLSHCMVMVVLLDMTCRTDTPINFPNSKSTVQYSASLRHGQLINSALNAKFE